MARLYGREGACDNLGTRGPILFPIREMRTMAPRPERRIRMKAPEAEGLLEGATNSCRISVETPKVTAVYKRLKGDGMEANLRSELKSTWGAVYGSAGTAIPPTVRQTLPSATLTEPEPSATPCV